MAEISFSAEAETSGMGVLLAWFVTARLAGVALWTGRYPVAPGVISGGGTACDKAAPDFARWLRNRLWAGDAGVPQILIDKDTNGY